MSRRKKRKYLNELGSSGTCMDVEKCGRGSHWKKQRSRYGFDERDTWSLNNTMIDLLYERVMLYLEVNCVDLKFHKVTIGGETKSQGEWVDELLVNCKTIISEEDWLNSYKYEARVWEIWQGIHRLMWW